VPPCSPSLMGSATHYSRTPGALVVARRRQSTNSIETREAIVGTMAQSLQSVRPGRDEWLVEAVRYSARETPAR
jgi:hypothetical protein